MKTLSGLTLLRHLLGAAAVVVTFAASASGQKVAIVTDPAMAPPAQHGIGKLREALAARGAIVTQGEAGVADSDVVVLAGIGAANGPAATALTAFRAPLPQGAEALTIRRSGRYSGKPAVVLVGSDAVGLMYAALDVADRVSWSARGGSPFDAVRDVSEAPYLKTRSMAMYTMNRAYFESRLYDERFWTRYFDMFAANRINTFVLAAGYENGGFLGPIYPYLFDVPGFPDVKMTGLTADQQARNLATFKSIIAKAQARGIRVIMGGWDHIDRSLIPFQTSGGPNDAGEQEVARARAAMQAIPGVVPRVVGLTVDNLATYTNAAIVRMCELLPGFEGFELRMHNEAGLNADVMPKFWHEIFTVLRGLGKSVDLRAKGVDPAIIEDAVAQGVNPTVNTKVWMEQAGLPFHPTHINRQNQHDQRHGYADLLKYPQTYKMTWQLWTGGTNRLLLWGDPDYVRRMAENARLYNSDRFEFYEVGATKMHGESHDTPPIPILTPPYRSYDYEFERYWHYYRTWGRLTYNPQATADVWAAAFNQRFGRNAGPHVMNALHLASQVLPRVVAASYLYVHFPTTNGWPEMQRQGSLPVYAEQHEGSDIQQFMNVRDAAKSLIEKTDTPMRRPEETSYWFANISAAILAEVSKAEQTVGTNASPEFQATVADLKILAGLARYHAARLLGGVAYNLYKLTGSLASFDDAIAHERRAVQAWTDMVSATGTIYSPEQSFGPHRKGFPRHWREELGLLKEELDKLTAERQAAPARPSATTVRVVARDAAATPPLAVVSRAGLAEVGRDVVVTARVTASPGVKWVRLRYRHLNQKEDYLTAEMTLDTASGSYRGAIPAAFVDATWDLMYFVEVVDQKGMGRMYPDLETETPYVVVPVKR